ncbi:MAG: EAL domain-containing protein [Acidobacteriota bacterium]|nr:EAL domain-containing protein [Acidobacteriota bacterium]
MDKPDLGQIMPSAEYFADYDSAYGEDIDSLLAQTQLIDMDAMSKEFASHFYNHLGEREESSSVLSRLSPQERAHLHAKQAEHLCSFLQPRMCAETQYKRALLIGRFHELVGVSLPIQMETYHLYHNKIDQLTLGFDLEETLRAKLRSALHQRLQLDLEAQIASHAQFDTAIVQFHAQFDQAIQNASNLADMMRNCLQVLGDFDGIAACLFSRPDSHGVMQIEAEGGKDGHAYAETMRSKKVPFFKTNPDDPSGKGPAGRAWRSGEIQVNNSFATSENLHPWRAEAQALGFRSSVAVPLLDSSGQAFAILSLYSKWPGFFGATTREAMLRQIQQSMSHAVLRYERTRVVSAELGQTYRRYLNNNAVQMFYQPIVDLRTGKLHGVEALARLLDDDGQLIPPGAFLPALGDAGLLTLFQSGLQQVCKDYLDWREQGLDADLSVSINLPPNGLGQDVYRDSVFEILGQWSLPSNVLTLEMLEDRDMQDTAQRDKSIAEYQSAGIHIAQDDLGSGYSSLLRMDRVACDQVKIDQALVRGTLQRPLRALEFIYHLTLLAQGFGAEVVVEGLEDQGLIEAAAILGADLGQGFGIARPMPAKDLLGWSRQWKFPVDAEHPSTALGALAGFLLWDHKLKNVSDWPEMAVNFVKEPWLVHRYIERNARTDSELASALERTQILALQGHRNTKYRQMRDELIELLVRIWLEERK